MKGQTITQKDLDNLKIDGKEIKIVCIYRNEKLIAKLKKKNK